MTWTAPKTFVADNVLTADELNVFLRDNMNELSPAKAEHISSYFVTTDTNIIEERIVTSDFIATLESTASTSYTNLATAGPTVTVETASAAMVFIYCHSYESKNGKAAWMSVAVSGATTISDSGVLDSQAIQLQNTGGQRVGNSVLFTNLNPGLNTFTAKYRVSSATPASQGNWSDRRVSVMPF